MSGLEELLANATPGGWFVDADDENLDVRAPEHAIARFAGAMTMGADADAGVKARALADARLAATAPDLARLALDMGEYLRSPYSQRRALELLARLDGLVALDGDT